MTLLPTTPTVQELLFWVCIGSQANFEVAKRENEVIFLEDDYEENYEGFDPNSPESLIGMTLMQEEYLDQSILLASLNSE